MGAPNDMGCVVESGHTSASAPNEHSVEPSTCVLFALGAHGCPTESLARARTLAKALGASLHVLRVTFGIPRLNMLFPQGNLPETMDALEATHLAVEETRAWLAEAGGLDDPPIDFVTRAGAFTATVAARAAELRADVIILPPREGRIGSRVTELVRATGRPVFVARRELGEHRTVVAATDLGSETLDVLRQAAVLARRLGTPLVAVHDIPPVLTYISSDGSEAVSVWPNERVSEACAHRMADAWDTMEVPGRVVVRREGNPADAILREAAARCADLIVVGWHRRPRLMRLLRQGVAATVVDRTERSVWVTPLDPPGGGLDPRRHLVGAGS